MSDHTGLVLSYLLDGEGGGRKLDWQKIRNWEENAGIIWVHLDRSADETKDWLGTESGLDPVIVETLLGEARRPRSLAIGNGVLVTLRGVNLNPGARPDDMVALRLWIEPHRAITLRHRKIMAIEDLRDSLEAGQGPKNAADFLIEIVRKLTARMGPVITNFDDQVDLLETEKTGEDRQALKSKLSDLSRQAIGLRRYISPQRDAISDLMIEKVNWLDDLHRGQLREMANWLTRYLEDLDAARERIKVVHDDLTLLQSEQMNRNTYVLSVVAAVVLPSSFIAGLFGVSLDYIPGAGHPWAFAILGGVLIAMMVILFWIFRHFKWL